MNKIPFKSARQRKYVMMQLKVPSSKLNKFKRCYKKMAKKEGYNPYAVCRVSTRYKGTTRNIGLKHKIDYRIKDNV